MLSKREQASPLYTPSFARDACGGLVMSVEWTRAAFPIQGGTLVRKTSARKKAGRVTKTPLKDVSEEGHAGHCFFNRFVVNSRQWQECVAEQVAQKPNDREKKLLHITVDVRREHQKVWVAPPTDFTFLRGSCRRICWSRIELQSHLRTCLRKCTNSNTSWHYGLDCSIMPLLLLLLRDIRSLDDYSKSEFLKIQLCGKLFRPSWDSSTLCSEDM